MAEVVTNSIHKLTKITKMEMKGFKSFANRVEVPFSNGFNCILGPNGSGKSNVLDSLCFVLGKSGAKGLRAEKTANLIYNGGKSKKPAKTGEVSIYFDNTSKIFPIEEDELKISRIVKQSGQSDYKINDETATRTQILDLLSHAHINPDGYNIILQGDIVRLVEMSSNDRRTIIEEISGISIYEEKKAKATRELDRVEQQLKEADIVLAERKTYLQELKKERDQAMKFKELDEKIKRNKATVLFRKIEDRNKAIEEIEAKIAKEQEEITAVEEKITGLKKTVLNAKGDLDNISREIEEKGEKEQVELHREIEQNKVDLAVKQQRQEQLIQELARISQRRKDLQQSQKTTTDKVKQLQTEITSSEKKISARESDQERVTKKAQEVRKKHDLGEASDLDERIHAIDAQAEKLQEEIQKEREHQQDLLREKDRLDFKIQTLDEKMAKVLEAQKENKGQLQQLKADQRQLSSVEKTLSTSLDRASAVVSELQTARGKLDTHEEELAKLRAKQQSIQASLAGSKAVFEILALKNTKPGIFGTVGELGQVDQRYALALEVAAGSRLKSVVVESDTVAQECITYLKNSRSGVATFLPLNKLSTRTIPTEIRNLSGPGVIGLAVDLVSYQNKYEKAFLHALGPTLVVQDINAARKIGIGKVRMVTVDGDLIESSGAMAGGHRHRQKGASGFMEKDLGDKLQRGEKSVADYQSIVHKLKSEQEQLTATIDSLRKERHELEDSVAKLERELHLDSSDVDDSQADKKTMQTESKNLEKKADDIISFISEKNKELAKIKMEKHKLREKLTALRNPRVLAELNTFEQQRQKLSEEIVQIRTQMTSLKNQISSIYQPELENIEKILKQQKQEEDQFSQEQTDLKENVKQMTLDLKEKEKKQEAFRKQFRELFDKRAKLQETIAKEEEKIISQEEKVRKFEHTKNASSIQLASLKAERAGIMEEFKDYDGVEPYKTKADEDIKIEIRQFEKMVQDLGAVNMKALEMFEHVQKEYDSLVGKKDVLEEERSDVLLMINEIDAKKRELFMQTFDVVEKHFKEIFLTLSRKGDAFLELENPEDPFAGGLNIRVRLSGSKFMDIRSLSGGEKTMTALAFLFAIQEHEPATFYVLDEVDAALDKKNSERLSNLVKAYANRAQYILISHNDTVISEADTLFGVSMNEHGESQVTSLKI